MGFCWQIWLFSSFVVLHFLPDLESISVLHTYWSDRKCVIYTLTCKVVHQLSSFFFFLQKCATINMVPFLCSKSIWPIICHYHQSKSFCVLFCNGFSRTFQNYHYLLPWKAVLSCKRGVDFHCIIFLHCFSSRNNWKMCLFITVTIMKIHLKLFSSMPNQRTVLQNRYLYYITFF